jgi:glutamate--cysteine ligase regulatory subunit
MKGFGEFMEKLDNLNSFRLHTGNINSYAELKTHKYKDSSEELEACLKLQLQGTPTPHPSDFKDDGTLLLCDQEHINRYERDDLKITIKVFISSWETGPNEVNESVHCLIEQLKTDDIELLILALPELDLIEGESENDEVQRWLESVKPIWREAEGLVASGKVTSLGIGDCPEAQLRVLCDWAETKPTVDHLKLDGCCMVPPELQTFAKENDIQLLTHNDPHPVFPINELFNNFCDLNKSAPVCHSQFTTTWAARYLVWVRRRSIMASKGYIVQFKKRSSS